MQHWNVIKLSAIMLAVGLFVFVHHDNPLASHNTSIAAQKSPTEQPPSEDPVECLDRVIQKRFHNIVGFGMARIVREKKFVPETKEEKAAVKSLEKAGLKVGLYLAGRRVLEPKSNEHLSGADFFSRTISNPIFVSSKTGARELPERLALLEPTLKAFAAFSEGKETYEFTSANWNVRARPVRAGDQSCLRCHSEGYRVVGVGDHAGITENKGNVLQVGDPIGVLLYVYERSR